MHHERSERHVRADRAYPLDDHRERRGRVLLLGKGAVLTQRVAGPLAAELDDEEQPARHGSALRRTVAARGTRYHRPAAGRHLPGALLGLVKGLASGSARPARMLSERGVASRCGRGGHSGVVRRVPGCVRRLWPGRVRRPSRASEVLRSAIAPDERRGGSRADDRGRGRKRRSSADRWDARGRLRPQRDAGLRGCRDQCDKCSPHG